MEHVITISIDDLAKMLDGRHCSYWAGSDVKVKLDPRIDPFMLGIVVGKSIRARELMQDSIDRLDKPEDA